MGIIIRKALPEDAYNFAVCHISCFQSAYKGIVPDEYLSNMSAEKEQRVEKYIRTLTAPGDCEYYCVMYAKRMVGFITIHIKDGEIWSVYLIEEFRNKGDGKEMLDFAINELKRAKHKKISLWVFEDNIGARRFYERHGFNFNDTKREMTYGKSLTQLKYVLDPA